MTALAGKRLTIADLKPREAPAATPPEPSPAPPPPTQAHTFAAKALTTALRERWPLAFASPPVPLKLGIHHDIRAALPEVPIKVLRSTMGYWTWRDAYQRALAEGGPRFGLDGEPVGQVTAEDQAYALERLRPPEDKR